MNTHLHLLGTASVLLAAPLAAAQVAPTATGEVETEVAAETQQAYSQAGADVRAWTADPNRPLQPPADWDAQQRSMYQQHVANLPAAWTAEQRAMFQDQLSIPPARWTAEQRRLYQEHVANLPADWTAEQREAYRQQIAGMARPWDAARQVAGQGGVMKMEDGRGGPEQDWEMAGERG